MTTQQQASDRTRHVHPVLASTHGCAAAMGLAAAVSAGLWVLKPELGLRALLPVGVTAAAWALHSLLAHRLRMRRAPGAGRKDWLDSRTGLLGEPALAELGEPLLQESQSRGKPMSLLMFEFEDLAEVDALYGARTRRDMLGLVGRQLRRLAGAKGLALRIEKNRFVVLLPGLSRDRAMEAVAEKIGLPCSFELESAQHELVLVPRLSVVSTTADTESLAQLLQQCLQERTARRISTYRAEAAAPVVAVTPVAPGVAPAKRSFNLPDAPHAPTSWQTYTATIPVLLPNWAR